VLLLAGEGALREKYRKLAADSGLSDKVLFLGWRDDVPALVKMADVVVSSAKQEGLPVNLIEAMMTGKPVIATSCRGNRELAEQSGLVADTVSGFSAAMSRMFNDCTLRESWGESAYLASGQYGAQVVGEQTERIYKTML
jgi:glycosyltransferase EpsD